MVDPLKKILFIDDDQDIHMILEISLEAIPNVEVRSAFSGEEGIRKALDFEPDMILLDVMMPEMDGAATLKAMRLLPKLAKTLVVFITARAQGSEVEEYLKEGAFDVVIKPFDPMALPDVLQNIWERFQKQ